MYKMKIVFFTYCHCDNYQIDYAHFKWNWYLFI